MARDLKEEAKPIQGLPGKVVKRRNIASLLSDLRESRGDSTADHVRSSLSSFFTWALIEGLMGDEAEALRHEASFRSDGHNHGIFDLLRLDKAEHLGPEVLRPKGSKSVLSRP